MRASVLGVPVDCVDTSEALLRVNRMLEENRPHSIIAINPEKVMRARRLPDLMKAAEGADLLIPDGIGVVFAARLFGYPDIKRVTGIDLFLAICELAERSGHGIFLFGSSLDANASAREKLRVRFPHLRICGSCDGFSKNVPGDQVVDTINASGASVLFVCLGITKQ